MGLLVNKWHPLQTEHGQDQTRALSPRRSCELLENGPLLVARELQGSMLYSAISAFGLVECHWLLCSLKRL